MQKFLKIESILDKLAVYITSFVYHHEFEFGGLSESVCWRSRGDLTALLNAESGKACEIRGLIFIGIC